MEQMLVHLCDWLTYWTITNIVWASTIFAVYYKILTTRLKNGGGVRQNDHYHIWFMIGYNIALLVGLLQLQQHELFGIMIVPNAVYTSVLSILTIGILRWWNSYK